MNETEKRAIEYIKNTGGNPEVAWFDEDHDPIGPMLRNQLIEAGLIRIVDSKIELIALCQK